MKSICHHLMPHLNSLTSRVASTELHSCLSMTLNRGLLLAAERVTKTWLMTQISHQHTPASAPETLGSKCPSKGKTKGSLGSMQHRGAVEGNNGSLVVCDQRRRQVSHHASVGELLYSAVTDGKKTTTRQPKMGSQGILPHPFFLHHHVGIDSSVDLTPVHYVYTLISIL